MPLRFKAGDRGVNGLSWFSYFSYLSGLVLVAGMTLGSSPSTVLSDYGAEHASKHGTEHSIETIPAAYPDSEHPDDFVAQANPQGNPEVFIAGENGRYTGQVLVTASIDTAWDVLTDYDNFDAFFPNVTESQLLESNGSTKIFEQVNVVGFFPFTRRARIVVEALETYPDRIAFNVIDGDVDSLQGIWQLQPTASGQVLITHQVAIEPESAATRELFFTIYRSSLEDTLVALRQEIEKRSAE